MFVNYFCVWNNIILCYERENITVRYFCGYQHSIVSENGGLIMLLTLIGIILCALGFAGLIFSADRYFDSGIEILSGFALGIGIIWLMVCIMFIIITHCTIRNNISNDQYEREAIEKQVEYLSSNYEDVSKTTVIQKAYDWNKKVYNAQYWSNNIWTNWFWSKKYVDSLKYIKLR